MKWLVCVLLVVEALLVWWALTQAMVSNLSVSAAGGKLRAADLERVAIAPKTFLLPMIAEER